MFGVPLRQAQGKTFDRLRVRPSTGSGQDLRQAQGKWCLEIKQQMFWLTSSLLLLIFGRFANTNAEVFA